MGDAMTADTQAERDAIEAVAKAIQRANIRNHRFLIPLGDPYRCMARAAIAAIKTLESS